MNMSIHGVRRGALVATLLLGVAGCGTPSQTVSSPSRGGSTSDTETPPTSEEPRSSEQLPPLPYRDHTTTGTTPRIHVDYALTTGALTDWVSFGDAFGTFTLAGAEESPNPDAEPVFIGVNLHIVIDEILWLRRDGVAPPPEFSSETIGWMIKDGQRYPVLAGDSPEWEPGAKYVGVFALYEQGWALLADDTAALVGDDGLIKVPGSVVVPDSAGSQTVLVGPGLAFAAGKSPAEVAAELDRIPPSYPSDAADLEPIARFERTVAG